MLDFHHLPEIQCQNLINAHHTKIHLDMKRLDLIHPYISGNKFYKLKYNIQYAKQYDYSGILSFGGAYSNHILALAYACFQCKMSSLAIIRGQELANQPLNPILQQAYDWGMKFIFVSRDEYKLRSQQAYLDHVQQQFQNYYILPEGADNVLGMQGCQEILTPYDIENYDYICCAVGTGNTFSGLISNHSHQQFLGFSALKGDFLAEKIAKQHVQNHWRIIDDYCQGGYAKISPQLIEFMQQFEQDFSIPLDPIYTAKMMYGIFDLVQQGYFPAHSRILAIHTGGVLAGQYLLKSKGFR